MDQIQLKNIRKNLKLEIQKFNAIFHTIYHREATASEKKPIAKLYENYTMVKYWLLESERKVYSKKLKTFEKDFLKTHGRAVKYPSDIKDVQKDYAKYKQIKGDIEKCKIQMNNWRK